MDDRTFRASPQALRQKRRLTLLLLLLVPAVLLVFVFVTPFGADVPFATRLFIFLISTLVVDGIITVQATLMLSRLASTNVTVKAGMLIRDSGRFNEAIELGELEEMIITRGPDGEIVSLRLVAPPMAMVLGGYEEMELLKDLVHDRAGPELPISIRRMPINWNHPLVIIPLVIVTVLLLIGMRLLAESYYELLSGAFCVLLGFFLLTLSPVARNLGVRYRTMETLLGIALLLCGILMLLFNVRW